MKRCTTFHKKIDHFTIGVHFGLSFLEPREHCSAFQAWFSPLCRFCSSCCGRAPTLATHLELVGWNQTHKAMLIEYLWIEYITRLLYDWIQNSWANFRCGVIGEIFRCYIWLRYANLSRQIPIVKQLRIIWNIPSLLILDANLGEVCKITVMAIEEKCVLRLTYPSNQLRSAPHSVALSFCFK